MWKLIQMDFYRLFSSKAIKIGALMAVVVSAVYMFFSLGVVEISKLAFKEDPFIATELGIFLPQVAWLNGVDFSEIVLGGTSALSLFIGCMISANFIGTEQSCGYTKNFAGQLTNKGYMAIAKFVVTSFAQLMVLVLYALVSAVFAVSVFGQYLSGYAIGALIKALGLRLMLHLAINAMIVFICMLTKSHAVAMVVGSIFGIGITKFAYLVASLLLSVVHINFNIASYMPDGINGQLSMDTVGELSVKAIAVSLIFMTVFLAANYVLVQKRDVK